jgi:hypothetical protein
MRVDEHGYNCPSTLGEYLEVCLEVGLPNNKAVAFLKDKISKSPMGENQVVIAPDVQMRMLLFPLLMETVEEETK